VVIKRFDMTRDSIENATERWKRTRKNRINRFFTCSKFLSANEIKLHTQQQTPKNLHAVNKDD